jgi:hypothetical protein
VNTPATTPRHLCYTLTQEYQDELHRPAFPYKFKFKFDGCPNCCVASIARADMSFIGTWKDDIKIDQEAVPGLHRRRIRPQRRRPQRSRLGRVRHPERSHRSLPHRLHVDGRQQAEDRQQGVHPLHALHQRHAARPAHRRRPRLPPFWSAPRPRSSTVPRWAPCWFPLSRWKSPTTKSRKSSKASGTGGWKKARTANVSVS